MDGTLDGLVKAMFALCATMLLQVIVQIATKPKNTNGHMAKELLEALKALQDSEQRDMWAKYPPEMYKENHDKITDIHGVVVTGKQRGAIPQRPLFDGGSQ